CAARESGTKRMAIEVTIQIYKKYSNSHGTSSCIWVHCFPALRRTPKIASACRLTAWPGLRILFRAPHGSTMPSLKEETMKKTVLGFIPVGLLTAATLGLTNSHAAD